MAFENLQVQITMLLDEMVNKPEDKHELAERIHEMLGELRATGMPLPEDLVDLEARLENEFEIKKS
jgi:hypothetical protein